MREIVYEQIQKVIREGVDDEEVDDAVLMMKKGRAGMLKNRGNAIGWRHYAFMTKRVKI